MSYISVGGKLVKVTRTKRGVLYSKGSISSTTDPAIVAAAHISPAQLEKLKGQLNGNCNVTSCQKPGATWWNTSTRAYYCAHCAREINRWSRHDEGYDICYPSKEAAVAAKAAFTEGDQNG